MPSTAKQYSRSATAALPTFDRQFLDESGTPLYVLSASDGTVGEIAVTLVEWIIRRRRIKVAPWQRYPRIATLLGELPNTALPKNPAVLRSSVGSGVSICATAALSGCSP